jgi:hypothetical protein
MRLPMKEKAVATVVAVVVTAVTAADLAHLQAKPRAEPTLQQMRQGLSVGQQKRAQFAPQRRTTESQANKRLDLRASHLKKCSPTRETLRDH